MSDKIKILAIDDEDKALHLFKMSMEVYGFEVLTATCAITGLGLAIKETPDLIVLDICMPRMDGWGVCRTLMLSSITNKIPIVFLTAYSGDRDMEKARELGACAFLIKPVNPDRIVQLINEVVVHKDTFRRDSTGETMQ